VTPRRKTLAFKDKSFKRFLVQFAAVKGDFDCEDCTSLTSLEGAPTTVGDYFGCSGCTSLTSLKGAPSTVGSFDCEGCRRLPKAELEIAEDEQLRSLWLKSKLPIKDFLEKYRGAITGRKFDL